MTRFIDALIRLLSRVPQSFVALTGRLAIGLVFWNAGRSVADGWNIFHVSERSLALFQGEYRIPYIPPEAMALTAQIAEHVLPVLIIIGLATRFAALGLLILTILLQVFVYPGAYVVHGTWAAVLLMLIKYGPGTLSADYLIYRR